MKPRICFFAGTKGGVGKSFAACQLVAAAGELGLSVGVFDSDSENSTLKTLLKDQVQFLDDTKEDYPLDNVISEVFQTNPKDLYVVDMKAGTSRNTIHWFSSVPWGELFNKADFTVICSITSDPDATRTLAPWVTYFEGIGYPVEFIIVKNEKDGRDFPTYNSIFRECLEKLENCCYNEITLPAMDKNYITILNNAKVSLKDAITVDRDKISLKGIMAQSRLKNYYRIYTDAFAMVIRGWLPDSVRTEEQRRKIKEAEERVRLRNSLDK